MFATIPCYNINGEGSADHIINTGHIEDIKPHDDVPVDPVEGDQHLTACCEATFVSGNTVIILLPITDLQSRLQALTGLVDDFGQLSSPAP